ncbi:MAG: DinB family protein [Bacteroidota bacterium]
MNRPAFLKKMAGLSVLVFSGCQVDRKNQEKLLATAGDGELSGEAKKSMSALRKELSAAWQRSETMTMVNIEQMPAEHFTFKYTPEAMSFGEQWRHCVIYTCGQLAGRTGLNNPYKDVKLPVQMTKDHVISEMKNLYAFVRKSITELSDEKLCSNCDFAGDTIPIWRLFYAMENHIIHHRGQCIVYLRLKGIKPKGYYGW